MSRDRDPFRPLGEVFAIVDVVVRYPASSTFRSIAIHDPATLEAALDAFALAGDVVSLEALTDTAGRHDVSDDGWRARTRFAASFTGAELGRSYAGALALAPTDDDAGATGRKRS